MLQCSEIARPPASVPGQAADIAARPALLELAPPMSTLIGDKGYDGDGFRAEIVNRATPFWCCRAGLRAWSLPAAKQRAGSAHFATTRKAGTLEAWMPVVAPRRFAVRGSSVAQAAQVVQHRQAVSRGERPNWPGLISE